MGKLARNKGNNRKVKNTLLPFLAFACLLIIFLGYMTSGKIVLKTIAQQKHLTLRTFTKHFFMPICGSTSGRYARCNAHVVTNANNVPEASTVAPESALTPQQLHSAYSLPCTPGGPEQGICTAPTTFGPTIALVDAYYTPTIQSDLQTFDTHYGLNQCTTANGCLQIINENGGTTYPATNSSWSLEESLDVQTAHAICQTCKIMLVAANSSSFSDLGTGVATAARLGAVAISNSYGASEFQGETSYDTYYNHPGIGIFASAGDSGYGTEYPAASKGVIGVGGTTLNIYTDDSYAGEAVWPDTGSGCSIYESVNTFQQSVPDWSQTGCGGYKGVADIAMDADPNTGIDVYDSTRYEGYTGWWQVGGTSLASVLAASDFAMAYTPADASTQYMAQLLYANDNSANFHNVTSGSNGFCRSSIMCNGESGYNGPTGLGSLIGIGAFGGSVFPTTSPAATLTPGPSLTPTATSIPPTATPTPVPALGFSSVTASIQASQAIVSWATVVSGTTTPASGTTQIDYGTNPNNLTSLTPYIATLTTTHSQTITNLNTNTIYYVKFVAKNSAGTSYISGVYYFRTQR